MRIPEGWQNSVQWIVQIKMEYLTTEMMGTLQYYLMKKSNTKHFAQYISNLHTNISDEKSQN